MLNRFLAELMAGQTRLRPHFFKSIYSWLELFILPDSLPNTRTHTHSSSLAISRIIAEMFFFARLFFRENIHLVAVLVCRRDQIFSVCGPTLIAFAAIPSEFITMY